MQEGQNRKTSSLSILAIAGVEPYQEKPGEEYMNEAQLSHFKRILEAWRNQLRDCLLYTSPSPRDGLLSRMPSSA